MSMIEKMARAMVEDFAALPATEAERDRAHSAHLLSQETVKAMAAAALSALEEPSESMIRAAFNWEQNADPMERGEWVTATHKKFTAMIQAAKGSEG